jgi:hypothetical protein
MKAGFSFIDMKVSVFDIVYDIDEEDGIVDLPTSFEFDNVEEEDNVADMISDRTGWCVSSFNYKII